MMKLLINKQIDRLSWQMLCDVSPFGSPFQTPEFYDFFNSVQGFSSDVFAVEVNLKIACLAVVTLQQEKGIKSWFSRRGIIYGGPLINSDDECNEFLLRAISKFYRRKLIYLEIRNYFDYSHSVQPLENLGFTMIPWLNYQLDINNVEAMRKAMSKSRLRHIKKATSSGAEWRVADKEEDVISFYAILKDLYISKVKKPIFPLEFFTKFFEADIGKFLLVYFENKVIGGIMCPILHEKTIYEFYVCGLDHEYKDKHPSVMATWAAMEYAAQNNIKVFDFMGAGSPDESYGVREFKARFGGQEVNHGRFLLVINPILYKIGKWGLGLLSKIN